MAQILQHKKDSFAALEYKNKSGKKSMWGWAENPKHSYTQKTFEILLHCYQGLSYVLKCISYAWFILCLVLLSALLPTALELILEWKCKTAKKLDTILLNWHFYLENATQLFLVLSKLIKETYKGSVCVVRAKACFSLNFM